MRSTLNFCLAIALTAPVVASGAMTVQFLGTGAQMTVAEAEELAGITLATDTRLTADQLAGFQTVGVNNFAGCHATPMLDPRSSRRVGTGIDCLRVMPQETGGVALEALSIFVFPSVGSLVTFGGTSVQPFVPGTGDASGGVTHMTGSIPADASGVVGGTGQFSGAQGSARVSGAVNLSNFPAELTFDCLWVLGVTDPMAPVDITDELLETVQRVDRNVNRIGNRLSIVVE